MKRIKYQVLCYEPFLNENGEIELKETLSDIVADYSEESLNKATQTAYNGISIEDDGIPAQPTSDERLTALETAMLEMMGVNLNG